MSDELSDEPSIDSLLREAARIAPSSTEPDRVGEQVGRYRIDEKLGQGGMGIVYAARDVDLGRRVALKVLPRAAVADPDRRRRFLREARTAAALSHPNLAALFDVGDTDGTVFLAMELVRGASLRTRIAAAPRGIPVAEALGIAVQIARGLGEAHAAGVVHRDLKPENVMMGEDGTVKVVDFGLAKLAAPEPGSVDGGDLSTQDGKILGTPSYMAPEQAKGSRVGATADVFSLGVVLYEMLTGERPFAGATLVDVLVAIARDSPAPPSKRSPGVSKELDRIVLRCLAKDPDARFADGAAVARALAGVSAPKRDSTLPKWALGSVGLLVASAIGALVWPTTTRGVTRPELQGAVSEPHSAPVQASPVVSAVAPAALSAPTAPAPASSSVLPGAPSAKPPAMLPSRAPAPAPLDPLARQK